MRHRKNILFLQALGFFMVALVTVQCAPVDGGSEAWNCPVEELEAGRFSFTVDEVNDGCGVDQIDGAILGRYPSVELPGFEDLPVQTFMELPLVEHQLVLISVFQDNIEISLAGEDEAVLDLGDCRLRFAFQGTLCPASQHEIDVDMKYTFLDATEITPGACDGLALESGCTVTAASKCRRCQ